MILSGVPLFNYNEYVEPPGEAPNYEIQKTAKLMGYRISNFV